MALAAPQQVGPADPGLWALLLALRCRQQVLLVLVVQLLLQSLGVGLLGLSIWCGIHGARVTASLDSGAQWRRGDCRDAAT